MEETQRGQQAQDVAVEMMASPSHPIHLFEQQPYLDTDSSGSSLSSTHEVLTAAAYANFVHIDAGVQEALLPSPVGILLLASDSNIVYNESSMNLSSQADAVPFLRRQVLQAITSSVQEAGPSEMSTLSDGGAAEARARAIEVPHELRVAICEHPLYPEMVLAHIAILKIGAPRELRAKLDDFTKKFQQLHEGGRNASKLGQDPELDRMMKSFAVLMATFRENLEEPFKKFSQFMDKTSKELENLCGHYVETKPEEEDNFGFDIGPMDGAPDSDDYSENTNMVPPGEDESTLTQCPADIDESIVVNPEAPEAELKKMLQRKYGRHIGALKADVSRVRKKEKLPVAARRILKDWFNLHLQWPYPSEMEKTHLQRLCDLSLKQINNWFINERKRHWRTEERNMLPNPQFNDGNNEAPREGSGLLEHW